MKRTALVLCLLMLASGVLAQAPPYGIKAGYLFRNGGEGAFAMFTEGNINLMSKVKATGPDTFTVGQVYMQLGGYVFDDVDFTDTVGAQIEAITGHVMLEANYSILSVALGGGGNYSFEEDRPDQAYLTSTLQIGVTPFGKGHWLRFNAMVDYIAIPDEGDLIGVLAGFGLRP